MASPSLITCGDNVKIWDSNGYSLLHQFQPNNTKDDVVTDVSWSRDGGMVASVTSRQALLVVTGVTADSTRQLTVAEELTKPTCCRFCTSNSRYVCVGSHAGGVDLWDNKSGKLVKQYQGHKAPVTRVCFSGSDRHVASGSRAGQVLVHNVTSGVVTELPTARTEPQCVRDLRYSTVPSAVVGAAFDTGHVSLWDVNQRRLLHTFTCGHVAPAAGLAFSPVNDILLASVGLDKRLVCYDPKSRSVIQTVVNDAPLTAVDFHGDGVQLAVGTSQGRVCVYDLRAPGRPSRAFTAHRSSVQRVQFQPPVKGRGRSFSAQVAKDGKSVGSHNHTRSAGDSTCVQSPPVTKLVLTHSTPIEDSRPPPVAADDSHSRYGQVSAEQSSLFSPLRDEADRKLASPPEQETTLNGTTHGVSHHGRDSSIFSPVRGNISLAPALAGSAAPETAATPPDRPAADNSLFSPLRPDLSLAGGALGGGVDSSQPDRFLNGGDVGAEPASRPELSLNGGVDPPSRPDHVLAAGGADSSSRPDELGQGEPDGGRPGPDGAGGPDGAAGDCSSTEQLLSLLEGPLEGERRRDVLAELAFGGPPAQGGERTEERKQRDELPRSAEPLPHSVVERLEGLQERMDDMWWGMRRENFNTQWSFGKHMYEVKTSMEGMVSTIEGLKTEVLRLREENQYLGCKF